jgi:hypothetical protein
MDLRLPWNSAAKTPTRTLIPCAPAVMYPAFCPGHCFGAIPAPGGAAAALLQQRRPSGPGSSLKGALQESAAWHLGAELTSLASPGVTPARSASATLPCHAPATRPHLYKRHDQAQPGTQAPMSRRARLSKSAEHRRSSEELERMNEKLQIAIRRVRPPPSTSSTSRSLRTTLWRNFSGRTINRIRNL